MVLRRDQRALSFYAFHNYIFFSHFFGNLLIVLGERLQGLGGLSCRWSCDMVGEFSKYFIERLDTLNAYLTLIACIHCTNKLTSHCFNVTQSNSFYPFSLTALNFDTQNVYTISLTTLRLRI